MKNVIKKVKGIMKNTVAGKRPNVDTYMIDGGGPWFLSSQFGSYIDEFPDRIKKWPSYKVNSEKVRYDVQEIEVDRGYIDPLGKTNVLKEYDDLYNEVLKQGFIHYSLEIDDEFIGDDNGIYREGYILIVEEGVLYACLYHFENDVDRAIKLLQ